MRLESARLFDVKFPVVAAAIVLVETLDRLGDLIDRVLVTASRVPKILEVTPLGLLVFKGAFRGHSRSFLKSTFPTGGRAID
jgi:hypothetical protein